MIPANAEELQLMRQALAKAHEALSVGEVPIGAVIADSFGTPVAAAHNTSVTTHDPTGHAEINAIRAATAARGDRYLADCVLYVTLEPCAMCAGAILHSRLKKVVFGAWDQKAGAAGSVYDLLRDGRLPHPEIEVAGGVLAAEAGDLLQGFFAGKRDPELKAPSEAGPAPREPSKTADS